MTCCWLQLFEKGLLALPVLQQRMKAWRSELLRTVPLHKGIMKSLDWPNPQHFDDARSGRQARALRPTGGGLGRTTLGTATCSDNELHVAQAM